MRPLRDKIILKPMYPQDETRSGIVIARTPDSELRREIFPDRGEVIETNDKEIAKGEIVVFHRYGSAVVDHCGNEYYIVPVSDVIAKIETN